MFILVNIYFISSNSVSVLGLTLITLVNDDNFFFFFEVSFYLNHIFYVYTKEQLY